MKPFSPDVKRGLVWFVGLAAALVLSRLTIFSPAWTGGIALFLTGCVLVIAALCPTEALAVLAAELIIGSQGHLFLVGRIPIRMLLFTAFFIGFAVWLIRTGTWRKRKAFAVPRAWLGLVAVVFLAAIIGLIRHQPFWALDVNAWGFLLLLIPALVLARTQAKELQRDIIPASVAALFVLALFTITTFAAFAQGWWVLNGATYQWIRRTGLGEVTTLFPTADVARIFFQSHIYAALAFLVFLALSIKHAIPRPLRPLSLLLVTTIIISLSRSLWIGVAAGAAYLVLRIAYDVLRGASSDTRDTRYAIRDTFLRQLFFPIALGLLLFILPFYVPSRLPVTPVDVLFSRAGASDPAAMSRWQMLPPLVDKIKASPLIGHGFGATVTFTSSDPRIVAKTGGSTTAYAFEWGWLDLWIKGGLLLVLAYLFLLVTLIRRARDPALIASIVALAATHVFSPYLNHPLGLGALIAVEAMIAFREGKTEL